jgi:hypothetical protein
MKTITLYKDLIMRSGIVLPKGTKAQISPIKGQNDINASTLCNLFVDGYDNVFKARYTSVCKQPSVTSLMRWSEDGICKSIGGKKVEPDGYDPDGFPSWLLVTGFI